MRLEHRPLAAAGFTALAVIFLSVFTVSGISVIAVIAGSVLFICAVVFPRLRRRMVPFFLAAGLILGGTLFTLKVDYGRDYAHSFAGAEPSEIEGVITDYPEYSSSRYYYPVAVKSVNGESAEFHIRLSLPSDIGAEPYDRISADVTLYKIGRAAGQDVERYYHSKGIFLGGYIEADDGDEGVISVTDAGKRPPMYSVLKLRKEIETRILDKLPNEYGGIATALLIGDKSFIPDRLLDSVRNAGLAPVFAVSGLHISIWITGLYTFLSQLGVRKRKNSFIGILFALFFMALTGFTPSVCRAGLMMILLLAGNLFFMRTDSVNSLGFAALVLCCINPYIAADSGFLMSFSATLGIVTVCPLIEKRLYALRFGPLRAVIMAAAVSAAAIISSLPAVIFFIGYISAYAMITNLLVTYAAAVCMIAGGITALFFGIDFISDFSAMLAGLIAKYISAVASVFSKLPFSVISTSDIFWKCGCAVCLAGLVFALVFLKNRTVVRFVSVFAALTVAITSVSSAVYYNGLTRLAFLNVGEGIAVVVSDGRHKALISGQTGIFTASYTVEDALNDINRRNPDYLFVTDDRSAVSDSTLLTLKNFSFDKVIEPADFQSVRTLTDKNSRIIANDTGFELWDGGYIYLHADMKNSYAYCEFDGVSFFMIFNSLKGSEYSEEFLDADYLVCRRYIPDSVDVSSFGTVIVSASEKSGRALESYVRSCSGRPVSTFELGNIYIDIRNGTCKTYVKEG